MCQLCTMGVLWAHHGDRSVAATRAMASRMRLDERSKPGLRCKPADGGGTNGAACVAVAPLFLLRILMWVMSSPAQGIL